jgi:type I restriction enzyme S subunit
VQIAEVTAGGPAPQDRADFAGTIPFIRVSHLANDRPSVIGCDLITADAVKRHSLRLFPRGTIVLPKSGASIHLGKRAVLPFDACVVSHLAAIIPTVGAVDPDYLFYWLLGTPIGEDNPDGYPTVPLSGIRQLQVPLPPLEEQQRIARVLSTIQGTRECSDGAVVASRGVRSALLRRFLRSDQWPPSRLGDQIMLQRGHDLPAQARRIGPIPVVSSSGVTGYHDEAISDGPGVIIGRYGTLGLVHYVEGPYWPLNTTLYVRDFKGNDPRFVAYALETISYADHNDKTSVPGVNRNDIHALTVPWPDGPEQRRIASRLATVDSTINARVQLSDALTRVFTGSLERLLRDPG